MLQIEHGLSMPETRTKYPFIEMEPGDSILFKTKKQADQPDRWYKIALPSGAGVWVDSSYLDAEKKVTLVGTVVVIPASVRYSAGR